MRLRIRTSNPARALWTAAGLGGLLMALMTATPAAAAPFVDVTYDLGDTSAFSTIPALNLTTEIPPHGTIEGTQTLRFTGGSGSYTAGEPGTGPTLAAGPAELLSFNLYVHATVGAEGYGGFITLNTSDLHFEFLSLTPDAVALGGVGNRTAGGKIDPYGASGYFRVTGTLHCFTACGVLNVPASQPVRLGDAEFTAPLPTLTGAVGQPQTIQGTATGVNFSVYAEGYGGLFIPVTGTTFVVGREIDRTAVPEPGSLPLLAGGLAGLGLAAAAWRRRRGAARSARRLGLLGLTAGLPLALAAGPQPAGAASTVDVTYDLADSDLVWDLGGTAANFAVSNDDDAPGASIPGVISGSMQVRYASDSSSGMPVLTGPATLQTFRLTVESFTYKDAAAPRLTATLRWQLTAPATASLTSGGALAGLSVGLLMTGRADCQYTTGNYCILKFGLPTYTVYPSYFRSGPLELAGTPGPDGGAQSTRHTLTGRGRAIGWQPGAAAVALGYDFNAFDDDGGAHLTGREVLREADGHTTKVIPEPGTLLLLGAGTAGLALVGRGARRSAMR